MMSDGPDLEKEMSDLEGTKDKAELVQNSEALRQAKY